MDYLLWIILAVFIVLQWLGYVLVTRMAIRYGRFAVLAVLLILYGLVFPWLFRPLYTRGDGPGCGMPVLGMILFFRTFGAGSALLVHLVFWLWQRRR